jgi:hypothetical protein
MKHSLFAAASLVALLPLLFGCGTKNNDNETRFEDPRFIQYAGQLIPRGGNPAPAQQALPAAASGPEVTFIELTESGIYVIGLATEGETTYKAGNYSVSGNVYTLNGYGTIEFSGNSGEVDLKITPNGGSAMTVKATLNKASGTDKAYRGFTVDKTRVVAGSAGADFTGLNFKEIADFLKNNGYAIADNVKDVKVASVSITGAGSFIIAYSDGSADIATSVLSGSILSYNWRAEAMGYSFETGKASISYLDGKCILTLSARINGTDGSIALVLTPMA